MKQRDALHKDVVLGCLKAGIETLIGYGYEARFVFRFTFIILTTNYALRYWLRNRMTLNVDSGGRRFYNMFFQSFCNCFSAGVNVQLFIDVTDVISYTIKRKKNFICNFRI